MENAFWLALVKVQKTADIAFSYALVSCQPGLPVVSQCCMEGRKLFYGEIRIINGLSQMQEWQALGQPE